MDRRIIKITCVISNMWIRIEAVKPSNKSKAKQGILRKKINKRLNQMRIKKKIICTRVTKSIDENQSDISTNLEEYRGWL